MNDVPDIPGYIVTEKIGSTSTAWKAVDANTGEFRVLKPAYDPVAQHAIYDESDAIEKVHRVHAANTPGEDFAPDIVRSFGIARGSSSEALVLEYLKPVRSMLTPIASTTDILFAGALISDALAKVHKAGYYHNDIKPENIIEHANSLSTRPKLIDFGAAMPRDQEWRRQYTFYYASPQRLAGLIDSRGDVYGLGAILHQLVSGRKPYSTPDNKVPPIRTHAEFAKSIGNVSLALVAPRHRSLPNDCRRLIEEMLNPDSAARPSLLECRHGLEAAIRQLDPDVASTLPPIQVR